MARFPPFSLERLTILDEPVEGDLLPTQDLPATVLLDEASIVVVITRSTLRPTQLAPVTSKLMPFYRRSSSAEPSRSTARADPPTDVINISDDEEGLIEAF